MTWGPLLGVVPSSDTSHNISRSTAVLNVSPHVGDCVCELVVPDVASEAETVNLVSDE
jgi:hypothetical protein